MEQNIDEYETGYLLQTQGWLHCKSLIDDNLLAGLCTDLADMYEQRRAVQIDNGIGEVMSGTCHHLLGDHNSMETMLANWPLDGLVKHYFGGNYILNSFGAFINQPNDTAYVSRIHRDVRTYAGEFRLLLNVLIMLDDFTLENGATYILSGSHHVATKPPEELFYANATRAVGKAGDAIVFDSNIWHAAGENKSTAIRRGLTLTFSRPFFKQQLDYPRLLGQAYGEQITPQLRQLLGYNARTPSTIDEYYQPVPKRFYQPDQG